MLTQFVPSSRQLSPRGHLGFSEVVPLIAVRSEYAPVQLGLGAYRIICILSGDITLASKSVTGE